MLPRVSADWRALLWVFGLMPAAAVAQYVRPGLAVWMLPLSMYLAYTAGVLAHNHNHIAVFANRRCNAVYATVLSFFYGYPTFGWIPTHNENHHRYVNRPGDATATWRHTRANTAWTAFAYFFHSASWQAPLIAEYLRRTRRRSTRAWAWLLGQYVIVFGGHLVALAVAVHLHGLRTGAVVYASALGIPAAGALWGLMFTNYVQHVDCDESSRWNHSRNFVSGWMNFLVFDNGFHTVHHMRATLHWSRARAAHAEVAHQIDPRLCESSIASYGWKTYVRSVAGRRRAVGTEQLVG
ncbi:MAG: beta-carotene hydroxylase [Myxococcales bacterium]|nr:beta-carotene hydroxylase [Myxococcales bacterium]